MTIVGKGKPLNPRLGLRGLNRERICVEYRSCYNTTYPELSIGESLIFEGENPDFLAEGVG